MTKNKLTSNLEFSRTIAIDKIPKSGYQDHISATEAERHSLCNRFDLQDIKNLEAFFQIVPDDHLKGFVVKGYFEAEVAQTCVVSLEPLTKKMREDFEVIFTETLDLTEEHPTNPLQSPDYEPILDGLIDTGELIAQLLGTALDPYPRKEGVDALTERFGPHAAKDNPFQSLKKPPLKPVDQG